MTMKNKEEINKENNLENKKEENIFISIAKNFIISFIIGYLVIGTIFFNIKEQNGWFPDLPILEYEEKGDWKLINLKEWVYVYETR